MDLTNVLTSTTSVVTSSATWIGTMAGVITDNAIILVPAVLLPIAGFGAGLLKRLASL